MGVIKFSGLILGIRGSLGGTTFSSGRFGDIIYKKPLPKKEASTFQQQVRAGFSAASYFWKLFTSGQRSDWNAIAAENFIPNRFGDLINIGGFDYYKRMMQLTYPTGAPAGIEPDLTGDPPYEHLPVSAEGVFSLQAEGYRIDSAEVIFETINDSPVPNLVNLYISLPVVDLDRLYFKTWYLVRQFEIPANLGATEQVVLEVENQLMPTGWRTFANAKHLFKTVAFIPTMGSVSVEVIYANLTPPEPPVLFPEVFIGNGLDGEGIPLFLEPDWFYEPWFELSEIPPNFTTDYQVSLSFGALLPTASIPPSYGYGPERLQNIIGPFGSTWFVSPGPTGDDGNDGLIKSGAVPPYDFFNDFYLPTRIRLYHIPSGTYGPYWESARDFILG